MRFLIFAALCAILPVSATAQAFRAESRLTVVPLNGKDFEVIAGRGEGPRGMWCAAADFAKSRLRLPSGSRLYVKSPRGPSKTVSGRTGLVFTTDPARLSVKPTKSLSLGDPQEGLSLPVHHAYSFCSDYRLRRFFLKP